MTKPAIRVEGLWKEYVLGGPARSGTTFREAIVEGVKAPLRRLARGSASNGPEERFWALHDVSFEVEPGEVVGIIGRNGAGKSTLLKILSRITAPTRGNIAIRGRVASLLEVGTGFHQELTGRENIRLNGAILGMSGAEIARKFDEIVAFSGVEKFIDTPVKRYSSGMQVRLAFAVAAHLDPEILVIDEVLAVGDAEFQRKCLGKMSQIAKGGGRTVLFVSHQLGMVATLCSRVILMSSGQVVYSGPAATAIDKFLASVRSTASSAISRTNGYSHLPASIVSIQLFNSKGSPADQVLSEENLQIRVTMRQRAPVRGMLLGVGLDSLTNGRLTTWFTEITGATLVCGDVLSFELTIPNPVFAPGNYSVTVALTDSDLNIIDAKDGECHFSIVGSDSASALFGSRRLGCVMVPGRWSTGAEGESASPEKQ